MKKAHEFHVTYSTRIINAKKSLKHNEDLHGEITQSINTHEPTALGEWSAETYLRQLEKRIDEARDTILNYESDFNADAYGYIIQDPWTDDEYLEHIANGGTIGGIKL